MNHIVFDRIPQQHTQVDLNGKLRFVICENPTNSNIPEFLQLFEALNVKHLVRTSLKNYDISPFAFRDIKPYELQFDHQSLPGPDLIQQFKKIVDGAIQEKENVAVQGVSGRTRAPLLVACYMCESGYKVDECISLIRKSIQGQIFNPDQIEFLYEKYGKRK